MCATGEFTPLPCSYFKHLLLLLCCIFKCLLLLLTQCLQMGFHYESRCGR
jgi:hypothetical protein